MDDSPLEEPQKKGSKPEPPTLEALIAYVRGRVFDPSILEGIEEPLHLRGLTFPELVELSRARAAAAKPDNPVLARSLERARVVLPPDASPEQIDELARRSHAEIFLSNAMVFRPEECSKAPIEGEGAELLREPGRAVIVAFAHTAAFPVALYALSPGIGRTVFVPNPHVAAAAAPLRMRQFWAEEFGVRYITFGERRIEVLRALLDQGEVCAFGVDQPGSIKAQFFGVPVLTNAAAAFLATRTGHPVVALTTWHDEEKFGARISRAFDPAEFATAHDLHRALLDEVETALEGDFSRFLGELQLLPMRDLRAAGLARPRVLRT
jgi:lauroyl/myristoyl acyltransferase